MKKAVAAVELYISVNKIKFKSLNQRPQDTYEVLKCVKVNIKSELSKSCKTASGPKDVMKLEFSLSQITSLKILIYYIISTSGYNLMSNCTWKISP